MKWKEEHLFFMLYYCKLLAIKHLYFIVIFMRVRFTFFCIIFIFICVKHFYSTMMGILHFILWCEKNDDFFTHEKSTKSILENEYFGPQNDSYLIIHPYSCFVSSLFDWISICCRFQWWSKQMFQTLLLAIAIIGVPLAKKE